MAAAVLFTTYDSYPIVRSKALTVLSLPPVPALIRELEHVSFRNSRRCTPVETLNLPKLNIVAALQAVFGLVDSNHIIFNKPREFTLQFSDMRVDGKVIFLMAQNQKLN